MASPRACTRSFAGFTLIEVLTVIALIGMIGGFALVVSTTSFHDYSFRSERDTLISALEKARSEAMNNVCISTAGAPCTDGEPHGVHFDSAPTDYVIFQGTSYAPGDSTNEVMRPQSALISVSGPATIVFTNLSGTTTPASVTISDSLGNVSVITVGSEGRIDW